MELILNFRSPKFDMRHACNFLYILVVFAYTFIVCYFY